MSIRCLRSVIVISGAMTRSDLPIRSSEFAELEDGAWVRHSARGDRLQRVVAEEVPQLVVGTNSFAFAAAGDAFRAEVTVIGLGEEKPAYRPLTDGVKTLAFPTLAAGEVRRVKDGPAVSGNCAVTLKSSDARGADARLSLVKRYLVK